MVDDDEDGVLVLRVVVQCGEAVNASFDEGSDRHTSRGRRLPKIAVAVTGLCDCDAVVILVRKFSFHC